MKSLTKKQMADEIERLKQEVDRLETEKISMEMELNAERYNHKKDNEYLIGERDRIQKELDEIKNQ